jgi:xanthine dehydrogenase accessory factor
VREVLADVLNWCRSGRGCATATVVATFRSAPRLPGAAMAVSADGEAVGSVSGGCVEGAVYELAQEVIGSGVPVLERYGVSDDDAFAVGLTCGGIIDVLVEPVPAGRLAELEAINEAVAGQRPVASATIISGPRPIGTRILIGPDTVTGSLGSIGLDVAVIDDARGMLEQGMTDVRRYGADGERRRDDLAVFVQSFAPPPRLLVFGAIDFATAVASIGTFLGYQVTVCDARPVFATSKRFPHAAEVVVAWPHTYLAAEVSAGRIDDRTVVCVLTHDPKFDVPLLEVALRTPAAYIGAMGSRRTHDDRLAKLREVGLAEAELDRLASPIGLDLGARTPAETAVSVAAEIIALRRGGSGRRLADAQGRIHGAPARESVV